VTGRSRFSYSAQVARRHRELTFEGSTLVWVEPFGPTLTSEASPTPSAPLLWPDLAKGPFEVRLLMQVLRGRKECVGIDIKPAPGFDPRPLLSSELRKVPMRRMIDDERRAWLRRIGYIRDHWDEVAEKLAQEGKLPHGARSLSRYIAGIEDLYSGELATGAADEIDLGKVSRRGGRPTLYDDAHYQKVAAVYTEAWRAGDYPTVAVRKAFTTTKTAAAKWVATCREKGLLPPTARGQVSGMPDSESGG
jgi:hypothetical protein